MVSVTYKRSLEPFTLSPMRGPAMSMCFWAPMNIFRMGPKTRRYFCPGCFVLTLEISSGYLVTITRTMTHTAHSRAHANCLIFHMLDSEVVYALSMCFFWRRFCVMSLSIKVHVTILPRLRWTSENGDGAPIHLSLNLSLTNSINHISHLRYNLRYSPTVKSPLACHSVCWIICGVYDC